MGSEAGGASVSSSSSSDEAELPGESREKKSSIDAGSEGEVMEVGERRLECWSGGCAVLGELLSLVLPSCALVVVMECRVGRFGVDLE